MPKSSETIRKVSGYLLLVLTIACIIYFTFIAAQFTYFTIAGVRFEPRDFLKYMSTVTIVGASLLGVLSVVYVLNKVMSTNEEGKTRR